MRKQNFNFIENLDKEVFVVGLDCEGIQQDYYIYYDLEEAEKQYNNLNNYNKDSKWSYTLEKCVVRESELETIEVIY